jgi:hypothetical protein
MKIKAKIGHRVGAEPGCAPASGTVVQDVGFPVLIERTGTRALVDLLRIKLGFPKEVFERAVSPVIEGYATVVQLRPAPESDRHARPGGLFIRGLELGSRALDYRRGQILPRGAAPEVIGAHAHRWSYAVLVAALLNGIARNVPDMPEANAMHLFERIVPPPVREWLAEDPALMRELVVFLSGDESASAGAIGELVRRAAGQSSTVDPVAQGRTAQPLAAKHSNAGQPPEPAIPACPAVSNGEAEFLEAVEGEPDRSIEQSPGAESGLAPAPNSAGPFMNWLRQGLADGSIRANQSGALVHFVAEGMLLVSPRIFREFARQVPGASDGDPTDGSAETDIGKPIQRQLLRAGWHVRAPKGVNILTYQVMRGDRAVSRLSGIVICEPGRFIDAVLPVNPLLVRSREAREGASPHGLSA